MTTPAPQPKEAKSSKGLWIGLGLMFVCLFAAGALIGLEAIRFLNTAPNPLSKEKVVFEIPRGLSPRAVAELLKQQGVITESRHFYYYLRLNKAQPKAGEYEMSPALTPPEVMKLLINGMVVWHEFRFPEGLTGWEIAKKLDRDGFGPEAEYTALIYSADFAKELGVPADRIEGYLFPAVHRFSKPYKPREILRQMVQALKDNVSQAMLDDGKAHGLENLHQILTLASIVEKETGQASERPVISSVFHNRMKKKMRLQTDPTVIYGLMPLFDGNLKHDDLLTDGPYNTYLRAGLPPGPIAQPGLAAIEAAVRPAETDYLFFVSKNDGTHEFTKTFEDHEKAIAYWQLNAARRRAMRDKAAAEKNGAKPPEAK